MRVDVMLKSEQKDLHASPFQLGRMHVLLACCNATRGLFRLDAAWLFLGDRPY